jgi:hypothetical protein
VKNFKLNSFKCSQFIRLCCKFWGMNPWCMVGRLAWTKRFKERKQTKLVTNSSNEFCTYLAGIDESIGAWFGAESRGIVAVAVHPHMHAIIFAGISPILIASPSQICGKALEFGACAKSPHSFAALGTTGPVVQVTCPVFCGREIFGCTLALFQLQSVVLMELFLLVRLKQSHYLVIL